ncbi:hypothetical protein LY78DRAFT_660931 [Colletotrichum sublineola]|uniref:Putative canalicular multispecific organic anion transporter 2 n=1 Tax=Colletotrichum sublineola TaxID=1173701 RepID=A0A066X672_COLSU|nr:hypothetical protein LY78DRAFT_660931 [Colletotrichum sublineola]KDN64462.1 putative canalicular multispecific organic anion transporter 2 [Colletotrichum sublineola]
MVSSYLNDDTLGPVVRGCRDDFDFTVKFEHVFFSTVPASIFIAAALLRLFHLFRKPRLVDGAILQWIKLSFVVVYAGLRLGQLVLSARGTYWSSQFGVASDTMGFLVGLVMIPLSFLEHLRSPQPSMLLGVYLLVTILFDIAQSRTLWLSSGSTTDLHQASVSTVAVALKAVILVLESRKKRQLDLQKQQCPEATSGIISLSTYFWVNSLFLKGFHKLLLIDDLHALDKPMSAEVLYTKLSPQLERRMANGHTDPLLRSLVGTLVVPLALPFLPRLCLMGFKFCQPLMIESLLNYLQEPADSSSPNKGYGFIGAAVLIYVGMATSMSLYWYFQARFVHMVRAILASAVYRKTTTISLSVADDSSALTLMNADVERVMSGFSETHEYWANTIEVALACWLLQRQIGAAFVAPVIVVIICTAASAVNAKLTGKRQTLWMDSIQQRVGATSKAVSNMKALKISAMSGPIENIINALRLKEISVGGKWRLLLLAAVTIAYSPSQLGPVMAFAVTSQTLDVTRIFTSMAYLMLLAGPLGYLFQSVPQLISAFTCLGRIQDYLGKEARVDFRQTPGLPLPSENNTDITNWDRDNVAIAVNQASFGWVEEILGCTNPSSSLGDSPVTEIPRREAPHILLDPNSPITHISLRTGECTETRDPDCLGYLDPTKFIFLKFSSQAPRNRSPYTEQGGSC